MKTKSIFLSLALLGSLQGFAQSGNRYLTVSYTSSPMSPKMVSIMREKITDPAQLDMVLGMLSDYKFHYVLHIDTKTSRSAYVLKSVDRVDKVSVFGHTESSIKDGAGNFLAGENFMQSRYVVKGDAHTLDWDITEEKNTIGKYSCLKAVLKGFPDVVAWFSPEIPVNDGPAFFHGLPGLVVKLETAFDDTALSGISSSGDGTEFEEAYGRLEGELQGRKTVTLSESMKAKDTFLLQATGK